jgi:hypothetical protein
MAEDVPVLPAAAPPPPPRPAVAPTGPAPGLLPRVEVPTGAPAEDEEPYDPGPGPPGALKCPSRFPWEIGFAWGGYMGARGA